MCQNEAVAACSFRFAQLVSDHPDETKQVGGVAELGMRNG
jgi:hypothetical protein